MFFSLLADEAAKGSPQWVSYVLIGVLVVILIVSMVLMNRRSKKREAEDKARRRRMRHSCRSKRRRGHLRSRNGYRSHGQVLYEVCPSGYFGKRRGYR